MNNLFSILLPKPIIETKYNQRILWIGYQLARYRKMETITKAIKYISWEYKDLLLYLGNPRWIIDPDDDHECFYLVADRHVPYEYDIIWGTGRFMFI